MDGAGREIMPYIQDSDGNCINQEYIPPHERTFSPYVENEKHVIDKDSIISICIVVILLVLYFIII